MADNNRKQPKLNSELALEIQRLMAESKSVSDNTREEDVINVKHGSSDDVVNKITEGASDDVVNKTTEGASDDVVNKTTEGASDDSINETTDGSNENSVNEATDGSIENVVDKATYDSKEKINSILESNGTEKKSNNTLKIILIIIGILLGLLIVGIIGTYIYESKRYENVFFENTYINNIDVAYKTPEEVKEEIKNLCNSYEITVKSRDRKDETIKASDIGLEYVTGTEIDSILAAQEPLRFFFVRNDLKQYEIPTMLDLDEEKLDQVCKELSSFDDKSAVESINAYLGDYDPNTSEYMIIPEKNGNQILNKDKAIVYINDAILTLSDSVDLEDIGSDIYPIAEIRADNADLIKDKQDHDVFVKTSISYKDSDIVLDGNTIKEWLIIDENGNIAINENMLKSFVTSLANHYDTVGKERKFTSWYGNDTSVSGGTFGWLVDQEAEFNQLKAEIPAGTVIEREPVFSKRGVVHGESDWGDTYVEINLAKQHLFFIKEGQLVVESDIVSGGLQRKAGTPTGVYAINYKSRNAVLRGPRRADGSYEYESPVSYWMPFNKGIGLHDASWRGSFGGNIYKYSGSHGCVNLPKKNAKIIYENIDVGTPVIVYFDDFVVVEREKETEKETETKAKKKQTQTQPATQAPTQPVTQPETQGATEPETQPETQPVTSGEIGPGVSGNVQTQTEIGPGVQSQTEAEVTTNVENLPGDMQ